MTTITMTPGRPRLNLGGLLFIVLFAAATISAGMLIKSHALKHSTSNAILNCPTDKLGMILYHPTLNRKVQVCEFAPGQWGELVSETVDDVEEAFHTQADSAQPASQEHPGGSFQAPV